MIAIVEDEFIKQIERVNEQRTRSPRAFIQASQMALAKMPLLELQIKTGALCPMSAVLMTCELGMGLILPGVIRVVESCSDACRVCPKCGGRFVEPIPGH